MTEESVRSLTAQVAALSEEERRRLRSLLPTERGRRLTALVVVEGEEPTPRDLAGYLEERLPTVMVPHDFRRLDALPRTAAGKLDRMALSTEAGMDLAGDGPRDGVADDAPQVDRARTPTPTEEVLLGIWRDVLGLDDVRVDDDFFEIGGDSLLSIRVIARAGAEGLRLTADQFFQTPTIARLATVLDGVDTDFPSDRSGPVVGVAPLSPIQGWFFDRISRGRDRWNQARAFEIHGPVPDVDVRSAVAELFAHHDALRTKFVERDGGWEQQVDSADDAPFSVVEAGPDAPDRDPWIAQELERVQSDMGLESVFRAVLFRDRDGTRVLVLVAHHLVVDDISWSVLIEDLGRLLATETPWDTELPAKTASTLEWVGLLEERAQDPAVTVTLGHWATHPVIPGAWASNSGSSTAGGAARLGGRLDVGPSEALVRTQPGVLDASVQQLLLAALTHAWCRWTGSDHLVVDLEGHGRDVLPGADVSRTVGWFTTVYPVWVRPNGRDLRAVVAAARRSLERTPAGATWTLLRYASPDSSTRDLLASKPSSPVLFNYLGIETRAAAGEAVLREIDLPPVQLRSPESPRAYPIEINARVRSGRFEWVIEYTPELHDTDAVEALSDHFRDALREISTMEPERFALAELDDEDLGAIDDILSLIDDD